MIIFRLREFFKKEHVETSLKQLIKNEIFSKEQLAEWQLSKLKDLLRYLKKNNRYFSNYIKDNSIDLDRGYKSPYELLSFFSVTDKNIINKNFDDWLSSPLSYKDIYLSSTSGSSGIPFKFYQSQEASDYKKASKYRLYNRFGIKISDYQICLGSGYNSEASKLSKIKVLINDRLVNHKFLFDVSNLTEESIVKCIKLINKIKAPTTVWGYTSALLEIANYSIDNEMPINNKNLKAVIYSGEAHNEFQDTIIKKAFNVTTIDEYNSVEGFIAGQCINNQMHLNEDVSIFEVLKSDGTISPYGKGELLITNLFNKDFPFIRYKNGDVVELTESQCPCNSCYKVLAHLDGRSSNYIINGNVKVPHAVCTHYIPHSEYRKQVKKFQIIQNEINKVVIKIVLVDKDADCYGLETLLKNLFNNLDVSFQYVEDIPCEKSGKFKDVINNIL